MLVSIHRDLGQTTADDAACAAGDIVRAIDIATSKLIGVLRDNIQGFTQEARSRKVLGPGWLFASLSSELKFFSSNDVLMTPFQLMFQPSETLAAGRKRSATFRIRRIPPHLKFVFPTARTASCFLAHPASVMNALVVSIRITCRWNHLVITSHPNAERPTHAR